MDRRGAMMATTPSKEKNTINIESNGKKNKEGRANNKKTNEASKFDARHKVSATGEDDRECTNMPDKEVYI